MHWWLVGIWKPACSVGMCDASYYSRILNLYAEENAIDDAMYFLGEALRREAITLEVFLKVIHTIYVLIVSALFYVCIPMHLMICKRFISC